MTKQRDTFCPAPWMTFYLEPNGKVDLCCIGSADLGSVHEQSLRQILTSKKVIEIKQRMLDNQPVPGCEACHNDYDSSLQHRFLRQFGGRDHVDYQDVQDFKLKYLDLRWNNTCNYACVYCNSDLSSLWAQIDGTKQIKITALKTDLVDLVMDDLHNLQEIYLAGGEPLMLKENVLILSRLAEINPSCKIICNTNLSQIQNNEVFARINDFEHVQWMISAEAVGDQYEYLRWPGKWSGFEQNLCTLAQMDRPDHTIAFNLVWMNLNGLGIWDYIDHLLEMGLDITPVSILPYNMDVWSGPWHLKHMPRDYLLAVKDRMSDPRYQQIYTYHQNMDFLDKHINDPAHAPNMHVVQERLAYFDQARNLDSRNIFPTIYSYITT